MAVLLYKKLVPYRYRVDAQTDLYFINEDLIDFLSKHPCDKFHPYFDIHSKYLTANEGYCWDGASYAINTSNLIIPSLIHDIGCQATNLGYLPREARKHFDHEYYEQCLRYGVCKLRAKVHYACIRLWGKIPKKESIAPYAKTHHKKII